MFTERTQAHVRAARQRRTAGLLGSVILNVISALVIAVIFNPPVTILIPITLAFVVTAIANVVGGEAAKISGFFWILIILFALYIVLRNYAVEATTPILGGLAGGTDQNSAAMFFVCLLSTLQAIASFLSSSR